MVMKLFNDPWSQDVHKSQWSSRLTQASWTFAPSTILIYIFPTNSSLPSSLLYLLSFVRIYCSRLHNYTLSYMITFFPIPVADYFFWIVVVTLWHFRYFDLMSLSLWIVGVLQFLFSVFVSIAKISCKWMLQIVGLKKLG